MKKTTAFTVVFASAALAFFSASFAAPQAPGSFANSASAQANQYPRVKHKLRLAMLAGLSPDERLAVRQMLMIERALRQSNRPAEVRGFYQDTLKRTSNTNLRGLIEMRLVRLDAREKGLPATLPTLQQQLADTLARLR